MGAATPLLASESALSGWPAGDAVTAMVSDHRALLSTVDDASEALYAAVKATGHLGYPSPYARQVKRECVDEVMAFAEGVGDAARALATALTRATTGEMITRTSPAGEAAGVLDVVMEHLVDGRVDAPMFSEDGAAAYDLIKAVVAAKLAGAL